MKQFFFTSLLFFTTNFLYSQEYTVVGLDGEVEDKKTEISDECAGKLAELKELCLKMYKSPEAVKFRKLQDEFYSKVHNKNAFLTDSRATKCSEQTIFWVEAHLDQTDFSSFEEAKTAWEERNKALNAQIQGNLIYYECMADISVNCGYEILRIFFDEMKNVYGMFFI